MTPTSGPLADETEEGLSLTALALPLARHWRLLALVPLLAGLVAVGVSYLIRPTYTATTTLLPPQQQSSSAAAALASLGSLTGLAGLPPVRSSADQYVALLQSRWVRDRLIDAFDLQKVYDVKYRIDARRELAERVRVGLGKKDGLITLDVEDHSAERAAQIANAHVEQLRNLTGTLSLTEAQQRRTFFESQLEQTRDRLAEAQRALESSGFSAGALRAEPRSAAESYARLRAEVTAAEVRLATLQRQFAESTPEIQQQQTLLSALRSQLARIENAAQPKENGDYIARYREYKYQEVLFELYSRQYEAARLDESRESTLIQVIDVAKPPERRSSPKRAMVGIVSTFATLVLVCAGVLLRAAWQRTHADPAAAARLELLRGALRRRRR